MQHQTIIMKDMDKDNRNRAIRRNIVIYSVAMIILAGSFVMAKYSMTESATVSVGVITAVMLRAINSMKEGYDNAAPPPSWFTPLVIFTILLVTFGGIFVCKMFSEYIYRITDGMVTPMSVFAIVAVVLVGAILCLWVLKTGKPASTARIYIYLIVVAVCLIVAQFVGSTGHSNDVRREKSENLLLELMKE